MAAAAGGTMTRRLRSTALSSGSRIQFASAGSGAESGGSGDGFIAQARVSVSSGIWLTSFQRDGERPAMPRGPRRTLSLCSTLGPPATFRTAVRTLAAPVARRVPSRELMKEAAIALKIMPHGRLQEWVADEKGYFTAEGLNYSFVTGGDYGIHSTVRDGAGEVTTGAFETSGAGRDGADVSCACHWATGAAASERAGQLVTAAYSVAPCAIFAPPESSVRRPEDLAGVAVGVGYHSGSHFATLQALEAVLPADQITLSFQGPPNERLDALLDRQVPAGTMWGVPYYIAEAFGFRKVLDATFMIGFLVTQPGVSKADIDKYLAALRRAQMEIDLRPELYKHYHLRSVPEKYRDQVDVRAFGTGERIIFLPYTPEVFAETREWVRERDLFPGLPPSPASYDEAALA